jgi:predicted nucleic acid-binding protein
MAQIFPSNRIIIDTGIVIALADQSDAWHQRSLGFISAYNGKVIVPSTIIPEACYMLNTYLGAPAEIAFIQSLVGRELFIETVTVDDLGRSLEIMKTYAGLNIGLVDASIVALAERLGVSEILTTDRRHFSVMKPKHSPHFDLSP